MDLDIDTFNESQTDSQSNHEDNDDVDDVVNNFPVPNDIPVASEDEIRKTKLQRKLESPQILQAITTPIVVSEGELLLMFIKFAIFAELTHTAVVQLFKAINCMFASNVLPDTGYFFDQLFFSNDFVQYHCICPHCDSYIGRFSRSDHTMLCSICEKEISLNDKNFNSFFATFDVKNNIKTLLERHDKYYNNVVTHRIHDPKVYRDIYDGRTYRKFVSDLPEDEKNRYVSCTFNCDGAPTFESSTSSIYPIQLMINELPIEVRTRETIVCGIWFGKSKPNMSALLKGFVNEMNELSEFGVECYIEGELRLIKPYAICCCVDSLARAPMQGIKQFNGYYSCSWCLHPGEYVRNISKKGGYVKFPLLKDVPPDRSEDHFLDCLDFISQTNSTSENDEPVIVENVHQENCNAVDQAMSECYNERARASNINVEQDQDVERAFGVVKVSPLINLKKFQMIDGFTPDDLHFARLGLGEQVTNYWFNSQTSPLSETLSASSVKQIDEILKSVAVPHQTMRLSRSFSDRAFWKGKEWENWILYYSLPIMSLYLKEKYIKHWSLFVEAFYLALKEQISQDNLKRIDYLMKEFVANMENLYTKAAMTYNVHQGLHLSKCIYNWGPTWSHNTFAFESGNGKLLRMIHAANGVTNQICRKLSMRQCDLLLTNRLLSQSLPSVQKYCSNLTQRNTQKTCKINSCRYFGAPKMTKVNWVQKLELSPMAVSYRRMVKNKCLYSSVVRQAERSNNSYAQLSNGSFVKIIEFIVDEESEKEYLVFKYVTTENAFRNHHPHLQVVHGLQKETKALSVDMLEKIAVFLRIKEKEYICSVPNLLYD